MEESTLASLMNMTISNTTSTTIPYNSEFCSLFRDFRSKTLGSSVPYIVNAALNVPLAIVTTFANFLVLLAMRHVTSIRLPSKLLLCSLVLTDLGVSLVVQSQLAVVLFIKAINSNSIPCILRWSSMLTMLLFTSISLLTTTAISLDRYAALFFRLNYQEIVTTRRVCAVLIFIWTFSLCFAATRLWNVLLWWFLMILNVVVCLIAISVASIKIYRRLRGQHDQQIQPQAEQQAGNTLNMAKYRRTASAMMWTYVLLVVCYLPSYVCVLITTAIGGHTALIASIWNFSLAVLLLNSCLNPFVYCLRLPEIQAEVQKQLRQFCCRSPQQ